MEEVFNDLSQTKSPGEEIRHDDDNDLFNADDLFSTYNITLGY